MVLYNYTILTVDYQDIIPRGELIIKGKGSMNTFLIPPEDNILCNTYDVPTILEKKSRRASFSVFFSEDKYSDEVERDITMTSLQFNKEFEELVDHKKIEFKDEQLEAEFDIYYHAGARKAILLSRVAQLIDISGIIALMKYGYYMPSLTIFGNGFGKVANYRRM
jgi:hypothetical protein